jgi:hypothetical protein
MGPTPPGEIVERQPEQPNLLQRWHQRVYRALFHRALARQPRREQDGVRLYFEPAQAERVAAALLLLRAGDPPRYRRVQRHLRVLTGSHLGTHYDATADIGCIDVEQEGEGRMLAAALVHEATHAWLIKVWRVPCRGPWLERQERLCLREERRCLHRLLRHAHWPDEKTNAFLARVEAAHREALAWEWWNAPLRIQLRTSRRRRLSPVPS